MSAVEQIKLLAVGLGAGESFSGLLCPSCNGGRTREKSLSITNKDGGLVWVCHRASCGSAGAEVCAVPFRSPTVPAITHARLYTGTIEEIPDVIFEYYLAKYAGLNETSLRQSAGWSPEYQRTVWTVHSPAGIVRGYELRSHRLEDRYKTLQFRHQADQIWADHGRNIDRRGTYVVLVEDIISATAVRAAGYPCVSLMGTNLNMNKMIEILDNYEASQLLLCLDRDATGLAIRLADRYALFQEMEIRALDRDLKYLTSEQIRKTIEGDYGSGQRSSSS
jgi:hypothetical protein